MKKLVYGCKGIWFHRFCAVVVAGAVLISLAGCQTSETVGVSVSQGPNGTTVTGSVSVTIKQQLQDVAMPDFGTAESSGYTIVINAPSSNFTLDSQNPVQATLTANTDKGYTSSVTVTLQPGASTTAPVASGYTVYTFTVPNTTAVSNWVQAVQQNSSSSAAVSTSVGSVFNDLGSSGTYTFYVQVDSAQTGLLSQGSSTYVDPGYGGGGPCDTRVCPNQ